MSSNALPVVAIVGRPNVGKSTLFNRFAGRRRVLVESTPGLTRDRIAEEVEVGSRRVLLVDTAGFEPHADPAELTGAVQRQAREALERADAILFVVDGKQGPLPLEHELADTLRRSQKPLALAVNKVDVPDHVERAAAFWALGLGEPWPVSAEHGGGAWELFETLVAQLPEPTEPAGEGGDDLLRVAIVGRPNVGKSSLANRLLGAERVVVSEVPGTTRDAIDVRIESESGAWVLVDTAGLRRSGRRHRVGERGGALMAVRALERAQVALVVVDAAEGATDQDAHVAALALQRGCAAAVLANKWDLLRGQDPGAGERVREQIARRLRFLPDAPVLSVSARTGTRVDRIEGLARDLAARAGRRVPTAELNRWLRETVARHEPAMAQRGSRRRPIRFFYATQTGVHPPTFTLFCTQPQAVRAEYRRFLENRLREAFGYAGTPLRLRLHARREAAP